MARSGETFIGYVWAETQRAFLFQDHFWHEADWMPKSQVTTIRHEETHEVVLVASTWICSQKGVKEFEERTNVESNEQKT